MPWLTPQECRGWRRANGASPRDWKRQVTFETPLKRLPWLTGILVEHLSPFSEALLIVDELVFDHPPLEALRRAAGETRWVREAPGQLITDGEALRHALEIALSGWVDFRLVFARGKHALRADHDEWTTVFSTKPGSLATLKKILAGESVRVVESRGHRTGDAP